MTTEIPKHPDENTDSDPDTEAKAAEMFAITKQIEELDEQRKKLRDELIKDIQGHRYFMAEDGSKRYAAVVKPEPAEVDILKLRALLPPSFFADVTNPKIDAERFKAAVARGSSEKSIERAKAKGKSYITREQFLATTRTVPRPWHIRFGDPTKPVHGASG